MKSVWRLVATWFCGTPVARGLTLGGLALCVAALLVVTYLPQTLHTSAFAVAGQLAIFAGSAQMPLLFGRMAQGHAAKLLPGGRIRLLASLYVTIALVALPAALLTPAAFVAGMNGRLADLATVPHAAGFLLNLSLVIYTSLMLVAGWLYLVVWFATGTRGLAGMVKALLAIAFMLILPVREIRQLSATVGWNLVQLSITWIVFGAGFVWWPRLREWLPWRSRRRQMDAAPLDTSGKEVSMMLGTHNPWHLVAGFALPLLVATRAGARSADVWMVELTLFSALAGATASQAAARSRALWLRREGSRDDLFAEVERNYWRQNWIVLATLLALMAGVSSYLHLPGSLLAGGLPLLVLASASSTYLGLSITRGMRWPEIAAGIVVVLSLMTVAFMLASASTPLPEVFLYEALLLLLVGALRAIARRRWSSIDWVECRPARLWNGRRA